MKEEKKDIWYACEECGELTLKPFENGDGVTRCEKCAVEKWEMNPLSKIRFKAGIYPTVNLTTIA